MDIRIVLPLGHHSCRRWHLMTYQDLFTFTLGKTGYLGVFLFTNYLMSHIMRKPVYAICKQGRRRSACAPAQISAFVVRCLDSKIPLLYIAEISRPLLVSSAEQASLSLNWSQTPKIGFCRDVALSILSHDHKITSSPTCCNEITRACPNLNFEES